MTAHPSLMYRDPIYAAMQSQARSCKGCKHLEKLLDREFCGVGRRELVKCKRYEIKRG